MKYIRKGISFVSNATFGWLHHMHYTANPTLSGRFAVTDDFGNAVMVQFNQAVYSLYPGNGDKC